MHIENKTNNSVFGIGAWCAMCFVTFFSQWWIVPNGLKTTVTLIVRSKRRKKPCRRPRARRPARTAPDRQFLPVPPVLAPMVAGNINRQWLGVYCCAIVKTWRCSLWISSKAVPPAIKTRPKRQRRRAVPAKRKVRPTSGLCKWT